MPEVATTHYICKQCGPMCPGMEHEDGCPGEATPAPSQPAGVREFNEYMGAELFRAQRDWLIAECARVGVTVNVIIGAPLEKAYRLDNAAERERDSLREALDALDLSVLDQAAEHLAQLGGGPMVDRLRLLATEIAALKAGKGGQQ